MKKHLTFFLLIPAIFIASCTTSTNNPSSAFINEQQMTQLSTLIASAQFLKDHCQRSDIPTLSVLTQTALFEAEKKGWNTRHLQLTQLQQQIPSILNALNHDTTSLAEKCTYFNQSLANFIEQTRQQ